MSTPDKGQSAAEDGFPRFAYLILSHKEPRQVEVLAARILELSPHGQVVVHHDLDSDDLPWGGRPPDRVNFVPRTRILWGDWSIVDATLRMVRFALEELHADWFVILSGEHWPVADLRTWEAASAASGADAFVEGDPLPSRLRLGRADEGGNMYLSRCLHRWVSVRQPHSSLAHRAIGGIWKLSLYIAPITTVEYSHRRETWFFGRPRARGRSAELDLLQGVPVDRVQSSVRRDHPSRRPSRHRLVPPRSHPRRNIFPYGPAPEHTPHRHQRRRHLRSSRAEDHGAEVDGPQGRGTPGSMAFRRGVRSQGRPGGPARGDTSSERRGRQETGWGPRTLAPAWAAGQFGLAAVPTGSQLTSRIAGVRCGRRYAPQRNFGNSRIACGVGSCRSEGRRPRSGRRVQRTRSLGE